MQNNQERLLMYDASMDLAIFLLEKELATKKPSYDEIYKSITINFFNTWNSGLEKELHKRTVDNLNELDEDDRDILQLMSMFLILLEQELIKEGTLPEDAEVFSIVSIAEDTGIIVKALESLANTLYYKLNQQEKP